MQLALDEAGILIFAQIFRQQVAAVGGRAQQHVVRGGADRAVQHRLQRLVTGIVRLKRQVVAINEESLRAFKQRINDVRQIQQIMLFHFDQS